MRNFFLVVSVLLFANIFFVNAKEFPNDITDYKESLNQVGQARFKVLFWNIYDSALFTPSGDFKQEEDYVFEITYLRDIEKEELIKRTVEQWQHLGLLNEDYQIYVPMLMDIWPDISEGDRLAIWVSQKGAAFYFNQQLAGVVEHKYFGKQFVAIWLSPKTSQPKLRNKLLGKMPL